VTAAAAWSGPDCRAVWSWVSTVLGGDATAMGGKRVVELCVYVYRVRAMRRPAWGCPGSTGESSSYVCRTHCTAVHCHHGCVLPASHRRTADGHQLKQQRGRHRCATQVQHKCRTLVSNTKVGGGARVPMVRGVQLLAAWWQTLAASVTGYARYGMVSCAWHICMLWQYGHRCTCIHVLLNGAMHVASAAGARTRRLCALCHMASGW
jgi:hypothetical protein